MKYLNFAILITASVLSAKVNAQLQKDSCCLLKKDIIGIWQRNSSIVGNGLDQNFQFFKNNSFVLNIGNDADDMRSIVQLKGRFRMDKDRLYFTIISKIIVQGPVEIADGGISLNIFSIEGRKTKEIFEQNPKEFLDPCYITLIHKNYIKINQEKYYKVK